MQGYGRGGWSFGQQKSGFRRIRGETTNQRIKRYMASRKGRSGGPGYYGKYVRRHQGMELKFHDLTVDDAVVAATGSIAEDSVVTIAQGTEEQQRIGRKITIKSINWRWSVQIIGQANLNSTSDVVRVILYLDKQCNGGGAAVLGVLETANYQSFNNLSNRGRFRILMDRTYSMNCTAGGGDGTPGFQSGDNIIHDSLYKKCNIPIEYDNSVTTGVVTSVRSNNIGILTISRDGTSGFDSQMRVRFIDG